MNGGFLSLQGNTTTSAYAEVVGMLQAINTPDVRSESAEKAGESSAEQDALLVAAALEDLNAFEKLVERYEAPLLRYIRRISSLSTADAEDVLQEIFLKAWSNLRGYQPDLPFSSWIYRIAHNTVISTFRKQKARGEDKHTEFDESLFEVPSEELGMDDALDRKQRAQRVQQVLRMLPLQYREVLILRFLEGHDYDAISDILRKPSGTVATLLHRAKKMFQEYWERTSSSSRS